MIYVCALHTLAEEQFFDFRIQRVWKLPERIRRKLTDNVELHKYRHRWMFCHLDEIEIKCESEIYEIQF